MKVEKVTLESARVRLEPLSRAHLPELAEAIEDGELWKLQVTLVPHPSELEVFFEAAEQAFEIGRELTFVTRDNQTGRVAGSTRFRCIEAAHKRLEIGFTFVRATFQRSYVNTEAKRLMLQHAFEQLGCNRVELLTDLRNLTSQRAIARIGATQEGILRSHMIMRDGHVRDSVIFSVTRNEWPNLAQRLNELSAKYQVRS